MSTQPSSAAGDIRRLDTVGVTTGLGGKLHRTMSQLKPRRRSSTAETTTGLDEWLIGAPTDADLAESDAAETSTRSHQVYNPATGCNTEVQILDQFAWVETEVQKAKALSSLQPDDFVLGLRSDADSNLVIVYPSGARSKSLEDLGWKTAELSTKDGQKITGYSPSSSRRYAVSVTQSKVDEEAERWPLMNSMTGLRVGQRKEQPFLRISPGNKASGGTQQDPGPSVAVDTPTPSAA